MGAEAPNDVDLLYGAGVRDMGMSLSSYKKRVKDVPGSLERFGDDVLLYLYDTSAYDTEATVEGLTAKADDYERFVHQWYNKFHHILEFDAPALGKDAILDRREQFYDEERFTDKLWVCWHPSYGMDHLKYLGESYTDVVVPVSALENKQALTLISALRTEYQTSFHCNGFSVDRTKRHELFDSVFMSTWSSALRHQDLYVPHEGNWIRRLPKDEVAVGLKRHASFIESLGVDIQMLIDGNNAERELYTVRLFRWLETGRSAMIDVLTDGSAISLDQVVPVSGSQVSDSDRQHPGQTVIPLHPERYAEPRSGDYPITALPGIAAEVTRSFRQGPDGNLVMADVPIVRRTNEPVRQCNTCSLSANCPAYLPGNSCKFQMPIQIRTREQMQALTEAMLELQASRVFFASFSEETVGYHDPTVGKEMDRFAKLASVFSKLGESKETLKVEATRTTQGGVLSQIFGKAPQQE